MVKSSRTWRSKISWFFVVLNTSNFQFKQLRFYGNNVTPIFLLLLLVLSSHLFPNKKTIDKGHPFGMHAKFSE